MRAISDSLVTVSADLAADSTIKYVQSSLAADLEAQAQAIIDAFPVVTDEQDWRLSFVSLAGGGDGGQCTLRLQFVNVEEDATGAGIATPNLRLFAFQGASPGALLASREALQPRIAALFTSVPDTATVTVQQTLLAGSSKGATFLGVLVVELTPEEEEG